MRQISGIWVWNDSLPFAETAVAEYNLTFKSGNDNYTSLYVHDSDYDPMGGALLAYGASGYAVYIDSRFETGFTNEVYKTIDFGTTPQTVSDNFYTYLTANATTTSTEQKAISLSNLQKFKELCDQTYAKTGGGSGGGTQLYRHSIVFSDSTDNTYYLELISTQAEPYSITSFRTSYNWWLNRGNNSLNQSIIGFDFSNSNYIVLLLAEASTGYVYQQMLENTESTWQDDVTPL